MVNTIDGCKQIYKSIHTLLLFFKYHFYMKCLSVLRSISFSGSLEIEENRTALNTVNTLKISEKTNASTQGTVLSYCFTKTFALILAFSLYTFVKLMSNITIDLN